MAFVALNRWGILATTFWLSMIAARCVEAQATSNEIADWVTLSSNIDGGFRTTQFFEPAHNASLIQWDSRVELWLPPFRRKFSWGPYVRVAGVKSSGSEAWENAWFGAPGVGAQVYPFSSARLRRSRSVVAQLLGPVRLFAEYNVLNYYDAVVLAAAFRGGLRSVLGRASGVTPYFAVETSKTSHHDYYWENRLLIGGGLRFTPFLRPPPTEKTCVGIPTGRVRRGPERSVVLRCIRTDCRAEERRAPRRKRQQWNLV